MTSIANAQTASGAWQRPLILDGALGTELERRGFETTLPLWSAKALIEAPSLVWEIHRDYVEAGAEVLTACTFRTTPYTLRKVGLEHRAEELTHQAVRSARAASADAGREVRVAGCVAPLEDCYHPENAPGIDVLSQEHARFAKSLADTEVDLILVETQNSAREAVAATQAALATGLPVWTALMPKSATEMFNGDDLAETARRVSDLGADVVLINCARPAIAAAAFGLIAETLPGRKVGVYPNLLDQITRKTAQTQEREDQGHQEFAEWLSRFAVRAAVLGGCCGTTPGHIAALSRKLGHESAGENVR